MSEPMKNEDLTRREFLTASAGILTASSLEAASMAEAKGEMAAEQPLTNDTAKLTPKTMFAGPMLKFDFPALRIGCAEYTEGPTGCTVFHFPHGATTAMDIRGGAPGTVMAGEGGLDAICIAGGSLYGLEAASGVAAELFASTHYSTQWFDIGLVRGAIIFDYGPRRNSIYPDKALGRAAFKTAQTGVFPLGPCGAGASATVGKGFDFMHGESAGQGGAYRQVGPTKIAVFTVVNAMGAIVNRDGQVVRGHRDPKTGMHYHLRDELENRLAHNQTTQPMPGNTTPTVLVTNQKLDLHALTQLARQAHSSLARAIQPFHTLDDGDVLFAVTTNEVENKMLTGTALGILASELAWDAVLSCYSQKA